VPTCWLPNATEVGVTPTAGAVPVPVKLTDSGLSLALSVMVIAPLRDPLGAGVNVTLMVQVPLAARVAGLAGQVWVG